jgi:hypothetical protein
MPEREIDRHRERRRSEAPARAVRRDANRGLALQRLNRNRAVAQVLARAPSTSGTVQIRGVGAVKVTGGNLEDRARAERSATPARAATAHRAAAAPSRPDAARKTAPDRASVTTNHSSLVFPPMMARPRAGARSGYGTPPP